MVSAPSDSSRSSINMSRCAMVPPSVSGTIAGEYNLRTGDARICRFSGGYAWWPAWWPVFGLFLANCRTPRGVGAVQAGRRPPRSGLAWTARSPADTDRQRGTACTPVWHDPCGATCPVSVTSVLVGSSEVLGSRYFVHLVSVMSQTFTEAILVSSV